MAKFFYNNCLLRNKKRMSRIDTIDLLMAKLFVCGITKSYFFPFTKLNTPLTNASG